MAVDSLIAQAMDPGAAMAVTIVAFVVALLLGSLMGAVILRAAAKWAVKIDMPFGPAYGASFVSGFITSAFRFLIMTVFVMLMPGSALASPLASVLALGISFLIMSAIFGAWVKYPDTGLSIGFNKGVLVTGVYMLICVAIIGVMVGVAVVVAHSVPYRIF